MPRTDITMYLGQFFSEALEQPPCAISYYVSRELAERIPGRAIIESNDCDFELEAYVEANLCAAEAERSQHNQYSSLWLRETGVQTQGENAWYEVTWRGYAIDVIFLSWSEYRDRFWIVADSIEVAKAFFEAVCGFTPEITGEVLVFECGLWRRSESLYRSIQEATFDQLILGGKMASDLNGDLERFFRSGPLYESHGVPWKRGRLAHGSTGQRQDALGKGALERLGKAMSLCEELCRRGAARPDQHPTDL
jgi:hypothetical protein